MNSVVKVNVINHAVVSRAQWLAERKALLAREKELTRLRDQITHERRALPWVRIEENYVFETTSGQRSLSDLFENRRQLMVQHFMLGPGWKQGCPSCSFMADHMDGMLVHLENRDITVIAVARAPMAEITPFQERMGWKFKWVSSHDSNFNHDFGVSFTEQEQASGAVNYNYGMRAFPSEEAPGISVFYKDDSGEVFHTYSTYGRGVEAMMGTYQLIDLTPNGRNEQSPMDWLHHHDRY